MGAKHTPAPWGYGRTDEGKRIILGDGGKGRYVATVQIHQTPRHMGTHDEPEREANADLLIVAPDLLAALEGITDLISLAEISRDWRNAGLTKTADRIDALAVAADAAILRAEGGK